jgi:hypothetical protein
MAIVIEIKVPGPQVRDFIDLINNKTLVSDYQRDYLNQILDQLNIAKKDPDITLHIQFIEIEKLDKLLNWITLKYSNWRINKYELTKSIY